MATEDVVRSMRSRMPWTVASRVFKALGLERSQGWRRTLSRVEDGDRSYGAAEDELTEALTDHLICGEKLVRFFRVDDQDMDGLRERAHGLDMPQSEFSDLFPVLLTEDRLYHYGGHPPYLTATIEFDDGIAVVLSSARYLLTREAMVPAELPAGAANELREFEQLIGVRHQRLQAADVLWIPAEGNIIEIRTDFPLGMHFRVGETAIDLAQSRFEDLLGGQFFQDHLNLFPVIQRLYDTRGDGRMVELGFMVSGSSQKLEKTRRDVECCREEAYHMGGVGALQNPIQPYRASVMWPVMIGEDVISEPEVTLRGRTIQTADPNAFLGELVARNCANREDYGHLRDRIVHHLDV